MDSIGVTGWDNQWTRVSYRLGQFMDNSGVTGLQYQWTVVGLQVGTINGQ